MANYCILCVPKTEKERVENNFFLLSENTDDLAIIFQSEDNICYYFAHKGSHDTTQDGAFKGYGIDYNKKEIIYSGCQQSPSVYDSLSGCYINIKNEAQSLVVDNDLFAQLPMLFFSEKGIVAISDSLFILTQIRRFFNLPNALYEPAGISKAWIHTITLCLLSRHTFIKNVYFCPPGTRLRIFTHEKMLRLHREKMFVSELFSYHIEDYRESIRNCAENLLGGYAALMNMKNATNTLYLSGGIDSRIILAACLTSPVRNSLHIHTNAKLHVDCSVAHTLAKKLHFSFSHSVKKTTLKKQPLTGWILSNAGIYNSLLGGGGVIENLFGALKGSGSEVFKGMFNWHSLKNFQLATKRYTAETMRLMAKYSWQQHTAKGAFFTGIKHIIHKLAMEYPKVQREISQAINEELRKGLLDVGITPENNSATEWHYLCYRNAIHAGRHTQNTMFGYNFLMQKELQGLSISSLNEYPRPKSGAPSVITDLLININPELACLPFDQTRKNMSYKYVTNRSNYLLKLRETQPFTIIGNAQDVHSGTPKLFIDLAMKRGFSGDFSDENIQKCIEQGFEILPPNLQRAFYIQKCIAENHTASEMLSQNFLGNAVAKLMSFCLLD